MRRMIGFVIGGIVAASVVDAVAQNRESVSLMGVVRLTGAREVPGSVRVRLESIGGFTMDQVATNGRFEFADVRPGWYTVIASAPTFADASMAVLVPSDGLIILTLLPPLAPKGGAPVPVSAFEYQIPKTARQQFRIAQEAARKSDHTGAIEHLKKAIGIYEQYAEAHNAAGNCYIKVGEVALAEDSFKKAVELTPSVYPALNLADLYTRQGRFGEAANVLNQAIRRSPAEGNGYYGMALLLFKQDRFVEAEEWANRAHERSTHLADAHLLLAKIHQRDAKPELVSRDLENYVKESKSGPARTEAQRYLAETRRSRK